MDMPAKGTEVCHSMGDVVGTVEGVIGTAHGEPLLLIARRDTFGGGIIVVPARQVELDAKVTLPPDADGVAALPQYVEQVPIGRYLDDWRRFTYSADATDPGTQQLSDEERALLAEHASTREAHAAHPHGPRPNADIAAEVQQLLTEDDRVNPHTIKVEVFNGVVVLDGEQSDMVMRRTAEELAFSVSDVRDVVNMIVVNASI
jgi:hypothetical protein